MYMIYEACTFKQTIYRASSDQCKWSFDARFFLKSICEMKNKEMKTNLIMSIFYQPPEMLKNYIKHNKHLYVPMNTGNLKGTDEWCDKHLYYETNFKENIAHLNPKINEMSLIWCYWKNLMKSPDYVGF